MEATSWVSGRELGCPRQWDNQGLFLRAQETLLRAGPRNGKEAALPSPAIVRGPRPDWPSPPRHDRKWDADTHARGLMPQGHTRTPGQAGGSGPIEGGAGSRTSQAPAPTRDTADTLARRAARWDTGPSSPGPGPRILLCSRPPCPASERPRCVPMRLGLPCTAPSCSPGLCPKPTGQDPGGGGEVGMNQALQRSQMTSLHQKFFLLTKIVVFHKNTLSYRNRMGSL